jgi:hypothetical protein
MTTNDNKESTAGLGYMSMDLLGPDWPRYVGCGNGEW